MFKQLVSQLFFSRNGNPTQVSDNTPLPVGDDLKFAEYLTDQFGDGQIKTFTFTSEVQQVWVYIKCPSLSDESRVTVGSENTPTPFVGTVVQSEVSTPLIVNAQVVKVLAPADARITIYGYRR